MDLKDHYTSTELKGEYTLVELKEHYTLLDLTNSFTLAELKPEFTLLDLKDHYTLTELKGEYTLTELNEHYTLTELKNDYTLPELDSIYTLEELKEEFSLDTILTIGTSLSDKYTVSEITNIEYEKIKSVRVFFYTTFVMTIDNKIYGCGWNTYGQLGDGTTTNRSTLTQMINNTGKTPKSIIPGYTNTIVLMTDRSVYGCGDNSRGQLGDGTTITRTSLVELTNNTGKTVEKVTVQNYSTIVLMTDGSIYSVGMNYYGQLGDGTTTDRTSLVELINNTGKTPKRINGGTNHTMILMNDGSIYGVG